MSDLTPEEFQRRRDAAVRGVTDDERLMLEFWNDSVVTHHATGMRTMSQDMLTVVEGDVLTRGLRAIAEAATVLANARDRSHRIMTQGPTRSEKETQP